MQVVEIPINDIWMDEVFNSRDQIDFTQVVDLAKSIKVDGLINPILLQEAKNPDGPEIYKIVAGHRRMKAYRILCNDDIAFAKIPSFIRSDLTETKARVINLNENLARKDLNILEEAKALEPLMLLGLSEVDIVNQVPSVSRGWVQIRCLLLKLPKDIQEEVAVGLINQTQIRDLYSMIHNCASMDSVYEQVRKAKDAKLKGSTYQIKKRNRGRICKPPSEMKHARTRKEILVMLNHMLGNKFEGLCTRALSWACGEITDLDLFVDFKQEDNDYIIDRNGLDYSIKGV